MYWVSDLSCKTLIDWRGGCSYRCSGPADGPCCRGQRTTWFYCLATFFWGRRRRQKLSPGEPPTRHSSPQTKPGKTDQIIYFVGTRSQGSKPLFHDLLTSWTIRPKLETGLTPPPALLGEAEEWEWVSSSWTFVWLDVPFSTSLKSGINVWLALEM